MLVPAPIRKGIGKTALTNDYSSRYLVIYTSYRPSGTQLFNLDDPCSAPFDGRSAISQSRSCGLPVGPTARSHLRNCLFYGVIFSRRKDFNTLKFKFKNAGHAIPKKKKQFIVVPKLLSVTFLAPEAARKPPKKFVKKICCFFCHS